MLILWSIQASAIGIMLSCLLFLTALSVVDKMEPFVPKWAIPVYQNFWSRLQLLPWKSYAKLILGTRDVPKQLKH